MAYKTIALTGAEIEVDISGQNCDIRNDGTGVVYASATAGITAGADGVLSIPAGGAAKLLDSNGTVHLLGAGSVLLCGNDYAELVFKTAASASGGGGTEDLVARNAIDAHAGNSDIHLTSQQLSTAVDNANIYAYNGDRVTLELAKEYTNAHEANADIHLTAGQLNDVLAASEQSANSYTDSKAVETLEAAKEYADGISSGTGGVSQSYVDDGDRATLTAAKEYADSIAGSGGTGGVSQTYVDTGDSNTLDAAKAYADSAVQPVSAAVDVLNGTGDGSVSKTVAHGIAQIIADAPEDLDTLKEISEWITAHPDDAAAMNAAIMQNTSDITENAAAIAKINSADSGILAQAKEYVDSKALTATEFTLTADIWSDSGRTDYPYKAVISDSTVTSTDTAEVIIGLDYLSTAQNAKMASAGVTFDGGIELYAKNIPTGDIRAAYYLVKGA